MRTSSEYRPWSVTHPVCKILMSDGILYDLRLEDGHQLITDITVLMKHYVDGV